MKAVVCGYYGFGNLGDELILESILNQLRSAAPAAPNKIEVTIMSADPRATSLRFHVPTFDRWSVIAMLRRFYQSDVLILGGGGLFQDKTSAASLLYYLGVVCLARVMGMRVVAWALGIETLRRPWLRWMTAMVCRFLIGQLSVRDVETEVMLLSWGVSADKLCLVEDPVFMLPPFPAPLSPSSPILWVPRVPCPAHGFEFLSYIGDDDIVGLFFPSMEKNRVLRSGISDHSLVCLETFEQAQQVFQKCRVVVSARYHGLVLAILAGRPFVGFGDPSKTARLCERWGQPFLPWNVDQDTVRRAIEQAAQNGPNPRHIVNRPSISLEMFGIVG